MTMKTAWLRKYPRLPGAARFQAYYVLVEVVAEEERQAEYIHQEKTDVPCDGGGFRTEYGPPEKRTKTEKWVRIRESGRLKWVEAYKVFSKHPHGCDPSVAATCSKRRSG